MAALYEVGGLWYPVPQPLTLWLHNRNALLNALAFYSGNQRLAAKDLDISERVMNYKMVEYQIPRSRVPSENLLRELAPVKPRPQEPPVPDDALEE